MLILSQNLTDGPIWIMFNGAEVEVSYLGNNSKGQVRLGFTAPKEVVIHRDVVYQRIQEGVPR